MILKGLPSREVQCTSRQHLNTRTLEHLKCSVHQDTWPTLYLFWTHLNSLLLSLLLSESWSTEPPPPGGVSYLLCSLIKKRRSEDPPRRICTKFFEGGPLTHGSWRGNLVNRKPPWEGGFLSIKVNALKLNARERTWSRTFDVKCSTQIKERETISFPSIQHCIEGYNIRRQMWYLYLDTVLTSNVLSLLHALEFSVFWVKAAENIWRTLWTFCIFAVKQQRTFDVRCEHLTSSWTVDVI